MLSSPGVYSSNQALTAYAGANSIATEALAAVRTVLSFNGEQRTLERYRASLQKPMQTGLPTLLSSALAATASLQQWAACIRAGHPHPAGRAVCRRKSRPGHTSMSYVWRCPCCAVQGSGQAPSVAVLWALPMQFSCAAMLWPSGMEE